MNMHFGMFCNCHRKHAHWEFRFCSNSTRFFLSRRGYGQLAVG